MYLLLMWQAQKLVLSPDPEARSAVEQICRSEGPEQAAKIGRAMERSRPELVREGGREMVEGARRMLFGTCIALLQVTAPP